MVHRYNEACGDPRRSWQKWDVGKRRTCSSAASSPPSASASFGPWVTMKALKSLETPLVMAAGTACIYLATLCMLRPLLLWKLAQYPPRMMNDK